MINSDPPRCLILSSKTSETMTVTSTMARTDLEEGAIREFKTSLRGQLLRSGDEDYDAARKIFNAMFDKHPGLIARCTGTADVISAVNFARAHNLSVAVRGGGHSPAGNSVCDGGMLIDLSQMKGMRVDPAKRTAWAQPGLRLGEFDRETQAFGLATTLGIVSNTGIAGLTLGGGIGWLNGKYGLACDNLLSVDLVTANGQFLTASPTENQDLFWGIRGGGGNFGIVTSFEYQLHQVDKILGGLIVYPVNKAREVLRFYDQFSREAPDELSTAAALLTAPDGNPAAIIVVCYTGSMAEGERTIKPLRTFQHPIVDMIRPMKYLELQSLLDEGYPPGRLHYWKSNFVQVPSNDAIDVMIEYAKARPSPLSAIVLQQMHGAAARVPTHDSAFPHRREQYDLLIVGQWTSSADNEKNINWAKEAWEKLQPFTERSVYVNDLGEEGDQRVKAAYGPNYERLVALKNKYDPTNFFHQNQNIKPTGSALS